MAESVPAVVAYPGTEPHAESITQETIRNRSEKPGPITLLFVGNLIPRKGVHTLLSAVSHLPRTNWNLRIIGDPSVDTEYTTRLKKLTRSLDIDGKVSFLGHVPDEKLSAEFTQSQVLVIPSRYESFGMAYLEGMRYGIPPIATTDGGPKEFITNHKNGILIPPDNPLVLANTIAKLHTDRDRLTQLSLAARETYLTHPDWSTTMGIARDFLREHSNS